MLTVFVVSDATGGTAERMVRAAMVQFQGASFELIRREQIRSPEQVRAVVADAKANAALIVHTLVSNDLRGLMLEEARLHGVDAMDLMGPMLDRLAVRLKLTPQEKPDLLRQLLEAKSREIEAVDFAFRHDDGANADEIDRAEIVLTGVSRTMKTPTMLYLAYHGWFTANVPIVPGIPLPSSLAALPPQRAFCLFMTPQRLAELRLVRAKATDIPVETYASGEQVRKELLYCERICLERGWHKIEVSGKSVEEVGQEIITLASRYPRRELPRPR